MTRNEAAKQAMPEYADAIERADDASKGQDDKTFFGELSLAIFAQDDGDVLCSRLETAGFTVERMFRKWVNDTRNMRNATNRDREFRQFGNGKIRMYVEQVAK